MAEVVGSISVVATINTKDYDKGKKHIEKGNNELEDNAKKTSSGFSAAWAGAIGGLVATVAQKGFTAISNSIDGAVKRVDTLNNSTRTFENMGIASTDSKKAMDALIKSIKGMPTPLDGAVRGMTALTATYGSVDKGQKIFSALNNAILGFGGSSAEVENAITQLSQLPMDGPLDAQTWNSLRNSGITPVLVAMAKDSGKSVSEMKEAFGSGELTVQDFTDSLVKMNKDGGGGLKSLEKIAKDSTGGIGTGFANMQTAISRGVATIIESIGSENISNAISAIGSGFEIVLQTISDVIGFISTTGATFTNWVKENSVLVTNLSIIFGTLLLPKIVAFGVQSTIALAKFVVGMVAAGVQSLITGARMAAAWLLALGPIGLIVAAVAGATALIIANWDTVAAAFIDAWNWIKGVWGGVKAWFGGVWNGIKAIFAGVGAWFRGIFTGAWNAIKGIWSAVTGWFRGVWNGIVGVFSGVGGWFRSVFQAGWNSITSIFGNIRSYFRDRLNDIKSVFSPSALLNSGRSLIDGLVRGISNGFSRAKNFVAEKMADLRGLFPFSPAKEGPFSGMGYTTHSGKALIGDFAKGIGDNAAKARKAAMQAMSGVQGVMSAPDLSSSIGTYGVGSSRYNQPIVPFPGFDDMPEANGRRRNGGDVSIVNNYNIENDTDVEVISRRQAYEMGRY